MIKWNILLLIFIGFLCGLNIGLVAAYFSSNGLAKLTKEISTTQTEEVSSVPVKTKIYDPELAEKLLTEEMTITSLMSSIGSREYQFEAPLNIDKKDGIYFILGHNHMAYHYKGSDQIATA
jgi:hypothetical protein